MLIYQNGVFDLLQSSQDMSLVFTVVIFLMFFQSQRDTVQECLQKHPQDRSDDDIEILLDFIQHFRVRFKEKNMEVTKERFYQPVQKSYLFINRTIMTRKLHRRN